MAKLIPIYVLRSDTLEVVLAFTWRGNADAGIATAKRNARDHGIPISDAWAYDSCQMAAA